jgi:hypothetical protein
MNTQNCPFGYATDEIFLCDNPTRISKCDANLLAYIIILSIFTFIRIILVINQFIMWKSREIRLQKTANSNTNKGNNKRFPVIPTSGVFTCVMFIIFTTLTATNTIGCYATFSAAPIFYIFWLPLNIGHFILVRRVNRFNLALLPISRTELDMSTNEQQRLLNEDRILLVLNVIGFSGIAGMAICWLIIAPIFQSSLLVINIGMIFIGILGVSFSLSHVWQLRRFIQITEASETRHRDGGKINAAITLMKAQQRFIFIVGVGCSVVWLLVGVNIIPYNYIVIIIYMSTEVMACIAFSLRFNGRKSGHTSEISPPSHNNNNNNNNTYNKSPSKTNQGSSIIIQPPT